MLNEVRAPVGVDIAEDDAFFDDCLYLLKTRESLFGKWFESVIKTKSNSGKLGATMANNWMGKLRDEGVEGFLTTGFHVTCPHP